jgi:hypothetical protein
VRLSSPTNVSLANGVSLTLPLSANNTKFLLGMGRNGGLIGGTAGDLPLEWKWGRGVYQVNDRFCPSTTDGRTHSPLCPLYHRRK